MAPCCTVSTCAVKTQYWRTIVKRGIRNLFGATVGNSYGRSIPSKFNSFSSSSATYCPLFMRSATPVV